MKNHLGDYAELRVFPGGRRTPLVRIVEEVDGRGGIIKTAANLAERMAARTNLLADAVTRSLEQGETGVFQEQLQAFREYLIADAKAEALHAAVARHVELGATVYTDEYAGYRGIGPVYVHGVVNHCGGEYVGANAIHVNSAESMWAVLKRGLYETWHKASVKHLHRHLNEAIFRLSEGSVKVAAMDRIEAFLRRAFKVRIDCRPLTGTGA